ncbi:MAG: sodium:solute symporter [Tepidisphaeraceae bacterium]
MLILAVFTKFDWLILLGYFALMATVGWLCSRKKSDAEGYFLAERSMPMWAIALSVVATSLSVATFLGAPQQSYANDLTYLSVFIGTFLAVVVVAFVFIPRFYRAGTVTIYGYIDQRLGESSRIAVACMFLLGRLIASGVRLFMAAIPLCLLLFADASGEVPIRQSLLAIGLIGIVGMAYTISGGIRAVIWTDTVQVVIVLGAVLLCIFLLLGKIPASPGQIVHLLANTPGIYNDGGTKLRLLDLSNNPIHKFTLWTSLIGATALNAAAFGVDHDLAQRMLTAKSPLRGGWSLIISQVATLGISALFMVVGLLLYIFYKRPDVMGAAMPTDIPAGSSKVYAHFLMHHLPSGLSGLAMAGLFAVAQGSLVSAINAMASSVVSDIYWPLRARLGLPLDKTNSAQAPRLAVVGTGLALMLFAVAALFVFNDKSTTLLDFALDVMSFAYSGMLAVFLTALLTRRGSGLSVMLALATGVVVTLLLWDIIMPWWTAKLIGRPWSIAGFWRMPIATAASLVVCVCGSRRLCK